MLSINPWRATETQNTCGPLASLANLFAVLRPSTEQPKKEKNKRGFQILERAFERKTRTRATQYIQ
jgi:hypothetical protein